MEGLCYCSQCMAARHAHGRDAADVGTMKDVWLRRALWGSCMECCQCDPDGASSTVRRIQMLIPGLERRAALSEDLLAALGLRKRVKHNKRLLEIEFSDMRGLRRMPALLRGRVSRRKLSLLGASDAVLHAVLHSL